MWEFLNQPFVGAMCTVLAVAAGYVITSKRLRKRLLESRQENIDKKMADKVGIDKYVEFKKKISREVSTQRRLIERTYRALIFIVSQMNGNPAELGLFDIEEES